jgi:flagellar hook-associated protein 1 FlgK
MLGLFGTLNLGARSLDVQQQASEVAGNNLANANNPAYAVENLVTQPSPSMDTNVGQEGTGVDAVSIQEVRDSLLDSQITSESSVTGSLNAQQSVLESAQAALGEELSNAGSASGTSDTSTVPGSTGGLAQALSNLFNSFQSLSTDPTSLSQRQATIGTAQALATQFNEISGQLTSVRSGINASIQSDVNGANQDLSDIANLNQQIVYAEGSGGTANELVDEREQKIEDLASKVNITTTTDSNGALDVSVSGVNMVSGIKQVNSLQTYDAGGGDLMVQEAAQGGHITVTSGSIAGEVDARDGALTTLQNSLDNLAGNLVNQVNGIYSQGYDLNGNTGQDLFTGTTAASIGVNSSLVNNPASFQASGTQGATGDNSVALSLAQLQNTNVSNLSGESIPSYYTSAVTTLGSALSSVNDQVTSSQSVTQMLTNQRSSESGVSIDAEMTNLMECQRAYEASAELITTVNQMLSAVMTMNPG